jgi:uncharacterized membrane protein YkvI
MAPSWGLTVARKLCLSVLVFWAAAIWVLMTLPLIGFAFAFHESKQTSWPLTILGYGAMAVVVLAALIGFKHWVCWVFRKPTATPPPLP